MASRQSKRMSLEWRGEPSKGKQEDDAHRHTWGGESKAEGELGVEISLGASFGDILRGKRLKFYFEDEASKQTCEFCPPLIEMNLNEELAAAGFWSSKKSFRSSRFANCSR